MEETILYENKERELTIISRGDENHIVVKFGELEVSMNKDKRLRDIAYMIKGDGVPGVTFDYELGDNYKWHVEDSVDIISWYYRNQDRRKLSSIKEAWQILNGKDE